MKKQFLVVAALILTFGLFLSANLIAAGDYGDPDAAPDPGQQSQSVARISVVRGQVSTAHGDAGEWAAGSINTPVVPGDRIATADRSRVEVQLDPANVLRLEERTEARVADLEPNKMQVQLASGLADFSVMTGTQADVEIDTPNMGVHPLSPGLYRIQVNSDNETQLIVRSGEVEVLTDQGTTKVEAGQIIEIRGADNPEYRINPAPVADDFDRWSGDRDRQMASAQSWQHSDPQYTGSGDLDNYGQWSEVPDYGWCWTPQVDAGWAPYSVGAWDYEPYWGYTWVSREPWGWAPYHYGRWFLYGGSWRWWPGAGAYGARAAWSPAYVSFFGFGRGFGVGVGFGSIGWLALGPRDVFHPWFGAGHSFSAYGFNEFHGAGFVHAGGPVYGSNLERMGSDVRIRGAIRNVGAQDFASGRMGRSMPVSDGMLRESSMIRGGLPVSHGGFASRSEGFGGFHGYSSSGQHFYSSRESMSPSRSFTNDSFGARSYAGGGFQGRSGPAGGQYNWQRYASPSSNYYGGSRQSLNLNRPIMSQRAPSTGYYGGGARNYSAPNNGNRSYSNPGGGYYGGARNYSTPAGGNGGGYHGFSQPAGGGSYSAPHGGNYGGGNGGGGHSYGGGGGGGSHSSGGGGGHGGRR